MNIDTVVSDVKQKEVVLEASGGDFRQHTKTLIPKLIENEEPNTLEIKNLNASSAYYVYAKGKVVLATDDMAAAVQSADANKGCCDRK